LPLKKEDKKLVVKELCEELEKSAGVVLTDYQGLDVQAINEVRSTLREKDIKYKVYKNTLIRRAAEEVGLEELSKNLAGCTAIAFSKEEPILAVKLLNQFYQKNKNTFKLKKALVEGRVFLEDQLERVANLPTKEELLAKMLGNMKSPITSFVFVLNAPLFSLANVIDQIRKQKEANNAQ
jgi:large subunit ribosomal protein L10